MQPPEPQGKEKNMASQRFRNFATVIYPESCPENFKEIIDDWHVPGFLSPLHDKDINPDGEAKKAHYHLIVMFASMKTEKQVKELFDQIGAVGCEKVKSIDGMARYLCHLDNPEKCQYSKSDVHCFAGADYEKLIERSADEDQAIKELTELVINNSIDNVADIYIMCADAGRDDLIRQLTRKSSYWFSCLCKANDYKKKKMLAIANKEKNVHD